MSAARRCVWVGGVASQWDLAGLLGREEIYVTTYQRCLSCWQFNTQRSQKGAGDAYTVRI